MGTCFDFPDIYNIIRLAAHAHERVGIVGSTKTTDDDASEDDKMLAKIYLSGIRRRLIIFGINGLLYATFTIWSIFKFVAIFACDSHLWHFVECAG